MLSLFKVLADGTRLRLLRILRQGDFTVQDLMQILDMGQSRISRHLKLMSAAGLLQVEKQGTWHRSEERRVGKECRARGWRDQ